MELHVIIQGKNDPPQLVDLPQPIIDLTENEKITFCVVEKGMQSGEPSVMIISSEADGSVVMQTSLDKIMTAVSAMVASAEERWGWERPEGHFSLMPPNEETRLLLLKGIKKELEEWGDGDGE